MRTQTTGSKTERNGTMTINDATRDNNRELSDAQLKQGQKGIVIEEILLGIAIAAGINAAVWAVAGILGSIFDWFD
jgi:hypothetical protein